MTKIIGAAAEPQREQSACLWAGRTTHPMEAMDLLRDQAEKM